MRAIADRPSAAHVCSRPSRSRSPPMKALTLTSIRLLGALGLSACVDEVAVAPRGPAAARISASTVAAAGGATSYVILGAGNALPKGLAVARSEEHTSELQ